MAIVAQRRPATPAESARAGTVSRERGVDVALVAVVAAGAVLRLWALGASKLSYDESFTAMAGRLPFTHLLSFLTAHDSHPPLDYLMRAPLARAGVSDLWFRMPSAVCSIAALVLLAVWLRPRGRVAVIAVALLALSAFEIAHGREARMYAALEPIGVGLAMVTHGWLRRPSRRHLAVLAVLLLAALFTHVSALLLAAGLITAAGLRRDREAWWWRAAIAGPVAVWATTWGPHFLVQAHGGHSSWIPPTSFATLTTAIAHAVTNNPAVTLLVVAAIVVGGALLLRDDRALGRTWLAGFAVPIAIGAVAGLVEPVVLDRTFTLMAWAPAVAVAWLLEWTLCERRAVGVVLVGATAAVTLPGVVTATTASTGPTVPLQALDRRVVPGDVVAVWPASKAPELQWSLGVRRHQQAQRVEVTGLHRAYALRLGSGPPTGRVWYLDWHVRRGAGRPAGTASSCGAPWRWGHTRIDCLTGPDAGRGVHHVT